jgi:UDP-4-amino-4,6-dideoxy-L-N-acetyl-beta-L-altrosamine transaminase
MFIPYVRQNINDEDISMVVEALKADIITRGARVEEFERAVAKYCDVKFAVAFSSGSAALLASCYAAEVCSRDRVVTSPNTFIATAAAAVHCRAQVSFADIDYDSGNIDLDDLEQKINFSMLTGREVLIPVHYSGIAVDMHDLQRRIKKTDTIVIEDASHALGGYYPTGEKVGACMCSDMTMFSFHPSKNITTGEGGMVTTNDEKLYRRLLLFRNNGIQRDGTPGHYVISELSGNYNLTDFQAALGLSQLRRLDEFIQKKKQVVKWYRERLQNLTLPLEKYDECSGHHLFVVKIDFEDWGIKRVDLMKAMRGENIGTEVHYIPLYKQRPFNKHEELKNTEKFYSQALTLPLYYGLTEKNVDYICDTVCVQRP